MTLTMNEQSGETLKLSMLEDAVEELSDWMTTTGNWVAAQFDIFQRSSKVGSGTLEGSNVEAGVAP